MSSPFRGVVRTEKSSKKIFTKTSALKMKLMQFSIAHAYLLRMPFNTVQIAHACLRRICQYDVSICISYITIFTFATCTPPIW